MPLYEYYCSDCQAKFELLVSHRNADDIACTSCHSEKVRRLLSVVAKTRKNGSSESITDVSPSGGGGCGCGGGGCGCGF
jgi:putative FmdB family regulatory protein